MKKRTIILIGLLVTLAVFGGGYGVYRFAKGNTTPVEVTPVSYLNIGWWGYETTSSGTITSNAIQEVHLDNDQVVAEVRVKEGDRVQIGDVLLTYDTTLLELDLESAEISRKSIELQLLTAKEELQKLNNITPIADPVDDGSSYDYEDPEYAANAVLMPNELILRASSEEQEMPSVESEEMGKGTEDPTEPVSDSPTEPVSDPPTESEQPVMDEAASRAVSESSTEPVIEQSAESQTELPTESVTEAPTEPVTEAPTEPVTEAPTEPGTEAPTEPVTEAPTEPVTEDPTEPVTEAPT
ncbi:MAG: biotin/lipoyl-binding protein, partial [Candidatus Limivivens sp.]|nr:biotin/lipoyl-binding protein [Candidatus Limivivens sp.]